MDLVPTYKKIAYFQQLFLATISLKKKKQLTSRIELFIVSRQIVVHSMDHESCETETHKRYKVQWNRMEI